MLSTTDLVLGLRVLLPDFNIEDDGSTIDFHFWIDDKGPNKYSYAWQMSTRTQTSQDSLNSTALPPSNGFCYVYASNRNLQLCVFAVVPGLFQLSSKILPALTEQSPLIAGSSLIMRRISIWFMVLLSDQRCLIQMRYSSKDRFSTRYPFRHSGFRESKSRSFDEQTTRRSMNLLSGDITDTLPNQDETANETLVIVAIMLIGFKDSAHSQNT
ncbi:hypothetical protein ABKN59_001619 [Abortiporus biennis]